ncbi:MAG: EamA family transporter [Acidobacteria bacterium]|nr:EamA family transporter [Acidobacteriota bacterium]
MDSRGDLGALDHRRAGHTTPTRTGLIFALEPVFAWLTSFLLLGETLAPRPAGGAALILAGILVVELKPFGRKPAAQQI